MSIKIMYTATDEAPALATYSLLPIVKAFTKTAGIDVELRDISLSGRIIANFPENLTENQRIPDELTALGELAKTPEANIIKLPNISASIPQLKSAIKELQSQGYKVPDYPEEPKNDVEKEIKVRYGKVLGSAVNPVLREGNSDRRASLSVKNYARKNPHKMGAWSADSKTHVSRLRARQVRGRPWGLLFVLAAGIAIASASQDGKTTVLKEKTSLKAGEVIDAAVMSRNELRKFYEEQI